MLTIKADAAAGCSLRDEMLPEMLALAGRTGCIVKVEANETLFIVWPTDTEDALKSAYDRLYVKSRMVTARMTAPWPRQRATEPEEARTC